MADNLEQIIVEYKLDLSTLKQQFDGIKTGLTGLKATAETSTKDAGNSFSKNMGKEVDDTKESIKKLGTEIKQALAQGHTNEAVKQLEALKGAANNVTPQMAALQKEIAASDKHFTSLAGKIATAQKSLDKAKETLAAHTEKLKGMSDAGKENLKSFKNLEEQIEKNKTKVAAFTKEVDTYSNQATNCKTKTATLTTELNKLTADALKLKVMEAGGKMVDGLKQSFDLGSTAAKTFSEKSDTLEQKVKKAGDVIDLAKKATETFTTVQKTITGVTEAYATATISQTGAEQGSNAIKVIATGVQNGLNAVMRANPIGAVITLVMGLVTAIGYFISKSKEATEAQKEFNNTQKDEAELIKDKLDIAKTRDEDAIRAAEQRLEQMRLEGAASEKLKKAQEDLNQARITAAENQMSILNISEANYEHYKNNNIAQQQQLINDIAQLEKDGKKEEAGIAKERLDNLKDRLNMAQTAINNYHDANLKKLQDNVAFEDEIKAKQAQKELERQTKRAAAKTETGALGTTDAGNNTQNAASSAETPSNNNQSNDCNCAVEKIVIQSEADQKSEAIKKAMEEAQKQAEQFNKTFDTIKDKAQQVMQAIGSIANAVFASAQNKLQTEFANAQNQLNSWQQRAMEATNGNAKKQAAIQRIYHAQQIKQAHEKAVKEAEIARKQAEFNKATKIIEITLNTASTLAKDFGLLTVAEASMNPVQIAMATAAIAEAVAMGAVQLGVAAAVPLPPIPKFATGVVGFKGKGTETSDSNPVLISHNESIITAAATKKYGAELEAINSLNFENLLLEKYLLPVLKDASPHKISNTAYDDWLLRKEIREGNSLNKTGLQYLKTIAGSVRYIGMKGRYEG